jgi:serine acetyltransferase
MVYVACGVSIAPSKKIGDGATIGIGSVVISNVKPGVTVFGNPAKKIDI